MNASVGDGAQTFCTLAIAGRFVFFHDAPSQCAANDAVVLPSLPAAKTSFDAAPEIEKTSPGAGAPSIK